MVDYDPVWPELFQAEAARLSRYFPQGCIRRIEHIGITAVPGLAAKPIVDILLGVDDFGPVVANVAPAMEEAGYDYFLHPEFDDDGPRYPWFIGRDSRSNRTAHIHVALIDDQPKWERVFFRDYLRRHQEAASSYAALKRDLVLRFPDDRVAYTLGKTAFIQKFLTLARAEEGLKSASKQGRQMEFDPL
ncbi:MAG: GrpB family protein [bacterium]|nr:GrpB family protein [bacterium]